MDLEQLVLETLSQVRPNGIEVEAYPEVARLIINLVTLELTKGGG